MKVHMVFLRSDYGKHDLEKNFFNGYLQETSVVLMWRLEENSNYSMHLYKIVDDAF